MGSWEEVLLFSMDFSVPKPFGISAAGCKLLFEKLAFAFLTDCVYWFLTSLKSCISRGLFEASVFLCWSRAVRSGVNQGLYLFLVLYFDDDMLKCLFKILE